jgi:hypothetical protein
MSSGKDIIADYVDGARVDELTQLEQATAWCFIKGRARTGVCRS